MMGGNGWCVMNICPSAKGVTVRRPRGRDRVGEGAERIGFSSAILPPYARLEVLIPILYLKGVSTGDFEEAQTRPGSRRLRSACSSSLAPRRKARRSSSG
jgi:hypothetical protein